MYFSVKIGEKYIIFYTNAFYTKGTSRGGTVMYRKIIGYLSCSTKYSCVRGRLLR